MSDPKREMAREGLIRFLADMNGHDRHILGRRMRDALLHRGNATVPNEFRSTMLAWAWTYPEWQEMFNRSGDMRKRELRRKVENHRKTKKEAQQAKRKHYMRKYMKRYRARKSIDEQEGD